MAKIFDYPKTKELCEKIFMSFGYEKPEAEQTTDILLKSDLYGIESHGLQRMIRYFNDLKAGGIDVHAKPEILRETPVSATIDAHRMMGQLAGHYGMKLAIEKAKKSGIGFVTIKNSNHYGIAGYYAKMAIDEDLFAISMTNSAKNMVPTYGKRPMLGTNPIAIGMPADPTPFLFDAATTVVARGKIEVKDKKGLPLPHGWAVDGNGNECTDPAVVLKAILDGTGGIMPLGGTDETSGYKGYGYGILVELFTGVFAGGNTSNLNRSGIPIETSHAFLVVDYGIFDDKAAIRKRFSTFLQQLRDTPKADGHDRIYIHGEKEFESEDDKKKNGFPVQDRTIDELIMICNDRGIDYGPYFGYLL